ncbi:MAG: response regulator [Myxococcales bacterium]|nr:response regulator [Myxococcales bacterium]MCB9712355.1 response regulator [Myxococcales bacterium]
MSSPPKILIVEDERRMRRFLATLVESHGLTPLEASTAKEGLALLTELAPDVVLLDLGLPDGDGLAITRRVREWSRVPIIVISARGLEDDKVQALDAGADDYLTKPFGAAELLARIRVVLRRSAVAEREPPTHTIGVGGLRVDLDARRVFVDELEVHLTPIEYKLLTTLARRPGRVMTHQQILREVWGDGTSARPHHVRVHMATLRRKIEDDTTAPRYVLTEIGVGYRFADPEP